MVGSRKMGVESFLATSPVFQEVPPEQLREIATLFEEAHYPAGSRILKQGGYSNAVYFLRSGRLAARVQRGAKIETIAFLHPPDVFGELSFVTGRSCVASVDVVVDADVVSIPREAVPKLPAHRDALLRGLMRAIAERLQDTVTQGTKAPESPVVTLRAGKNWEAPHAFGGALARSLGRQTGREALVVHVGAVEARDLHPVEDNTNRCDLAAKASDSAFRGELAARLTAWSKRFHNIVVNPVGPDAATIASVAATFSNTVGDLLGPGDPVPAEAAMGRFAVQTAARPSLAYLCGSRQLIQDAAGAEGAYMAGRQPNERFLRTVDSIARSITGTQVGLALGGGAAWGWAHIGVLSVLEKAGMPIDVVSGCSMGAVIGAFRCSGIGVDGLLEIAEYWRSRTRRFIEWRFWRMCLLNEKAVRKTFHSYFGDRPVNQTEIPFWANAVDIKTGKEYLIQDGTLVDCVRASIALPGLLPPAPRPPHLLVDSGIMDPVPVTLIGRMGARYLIAVNAMAGLEEQEMSTRYPANLVDLMSRVTRIMGHEIGQARVEEAADVVMTPKLGDITMLQFARAPEIIERGRQVASEHIDAILAGYERLKAETLPAPGLAVNTR
ncbi:MAG: patatin-like phospholipase family protein [Bryobacteraceae bacterium]